MSFHSDESPIDPGERLALEGEDPSVVEAAPTPTPTPMQRRATRIARGGAAVFATSILLKGTSMIASILIARHLGPYQLGQWALVTYVAGFMWILIELGTGTAAVRVISAARAKDPERAVRITKNYVFIEILFSLPVLGLFLAMAPWLSEGLYRDPVLLPLFWLSIGTMFVSTFTTCYGAILQGYERIGLLARLTLVFGLTHSILLVVFVLLWGLVGGFTASLLAALVQLGIYMYFSRSPNPLQWRGWRPDRAILRELLVFSLPAFATMFFLVTFNWIGATLVTAQSGVEGLGHYTVAQRVAFLVLYIPNAVVVPFFPMASNLYQKNPSEFTRTFNHALRYVLIFVFPVVMLVSTLARPIISVVYTDAYSEAATLLPITAGAAFLAAFLSPGNLAYYVTGAMRRHAMLSTIVFGVAVVALLVLVPDLGVLGFAWAILIYYGTSTVLSPWMLGRYFTDRRYRLLSFVALALSGATLASGLLLQRLDVMTSSLAASGLIGGSIVVTYLKVMTKRDRAFLRSLIRRSRESVRGQE